LQAEIKIMLPNLLAAADFAAAAAFFFFFDSFSAALAFLPAPNTIDMLTLARVADAGVVAR